MYLSTSKPALLVLEVPKLSTCLLHLSKCLPTPAPSKLYKSGATIFVRLYQYLYFCTSKARKLSTYPLDLAHGLHLHPQQLCQYSYFCTGKPALLLVSLLYCQQSTCVLSISRDLAHCLHPHHQQLRHSPTFVLAIQLYCTFFLKKLKYLSPLSRALPPLSPPAAPPLFYVCTSNPSSLVL